MLPVPHLMRTDASGLNLATTLSQKCVPTDLGPKCYIALGRPEERGPGDSVTRCHLDMSDAINVMLDVQKPPHGPSRTTQPWQLPHYQVRPPGPPRSWWPLTLHGSSVSRGERTMPVSQEVKPAVRAVGARLCKQVCEWVDEVWHGAGGLPCIFN